MTARTSDIEEAVGVLRAGGLVALPAETVHGLGGPERLDDRVRDVPATPACWLDASGRGL